MQALVKTLAYMVPHLAKVLYYHTDILHYIPESIQRVGVQNTHHQL